MGWRANAELETRNGDLQHLLKLLKPATESILSKYIDSAATARPPSPGANRAAMLSAREKRSAAKEVDETVKRLELQHERVVFLERELAACQEAKHQAVTSRAEVVKRLDEERKRGDGLEGQLGEMRSKLARAQRQIELLKNPTGETQDDANADPDKPKPLHERVKDEVRKRDEKREAIRKEAESKSTFAPKLDESSAGIGASTGASKPTPRSADAKPTSVAAAMKAVEAKAPAEKVEAEPKRNEIVDDIDVAAQTAQLKATMVELTTEKRLRQEAETAAARYQAQEVAANQRKAEIENLLQKMTTKERDQTAELQNALRAAKDAKAELDFAKKVADSAQLDAAQKADKARQLERERNSWEAERGRCRAEKDDALAQVAEQEERSKVAEAALKAIADAAPPPASAVAAARQKQGIKENPNADAVVKQQTKAKIEKHRLMAEEEKRLRAKADRDCKAAVEEQKRLQGEIEKLVAAAEATHAAGGADALVAGSASKTVADERARREKAETALDRFTRISALQRAAQEALQFTINSPGRGTTDAAESSEADEALNRLAMEIRASGLGKLGDSRSQTPSLTATASPRKLEVGSPSPQQSPLASRNEPTLFTRERSGSNVAEPQKMVMSPAETIGGQPGAAP